MYGYSFRTILRWNFNQYKVFIIHVIHINHQFEILIIYLPDDILLDDVDGSVASPSKVMMHRVQSSASGTSVSENGLTNGNTHSKVTNNHYNT